MKFNILHLNAPTALAGAERVLLTYLAHHDRSTFQLFLLSFVNEFIADNDFTREADTCGIVFKKIRILGYANLTDQLRTVAGFIRDNNINLVHTHGYRSDIAGFLVTRLTGVPVVSTLHGWTPVTRSLRCYEALDRFCLRRFDHLICVSRDLHDEMLRLVTPERVTLLPNAVTLPTGEGGLPEGWSRKGCTILYAGRLSPEKGVDVLLRAFARSCVAHEEVRLLLVGDGPNRGDYELLAGELGIADRVHFLGFRNDIQAFYRLADLFVLPSRSEGLPMALLEAMALGTPVVATRVGGVPDLVTDGVTGLLVAPDDPIALGAAIRRVVDCRGEALERGTRARVKVVREFAAAPWARSMESLYRKIIASR